MKSKDQQLLEEAYIKVLKENRSSNPFDQVDDWFRQTYASQTFPGGAEIIDEDIPYTSKVTEKYGRPYYSPSINSDLIYDLTYVYYPEEQYFVKHSSSVKTKLATADDVKKDIAKQIANVQNLSKEEHAEANHNL